MAERKTSKRGPDEKFCENCGALIAKEAVVCPKCGVALGSLRAKLAKLEGASDKSRLVAILLCWFFGVFGVHRFYVGKTVTGIIWVFTFGCLYVGVIVDLILIASGTFTDKEGRPVLDWRAD